MAGAIFGGAWPEVGLTPGLSGDAVARLQRFLQTYGYLRHDADDSVHAAAAEPGDEPWAEPGVFDVATETALRAFQRLHRLEQTGILDAPTAAEMAQPRCGVPDTPYGPSATGDPWPTPALRYGFTSLTPDLPAAEVQTAIALALALWSSVSRLTFTLAPVGSGPQMVIGFAAGDHGDGLPFDGPGGTLAHGFYPPPPDGPLTGDVHFDEAETWAAALPIPPGATDLITVALHEIGHALGLGHSTDPSAIMFPSYSGPRRALGLDDVQRIQAMYGVAPPPIPPYPQPPIDPPQDPAVRRLIDEWIQQQNTCVKRLHPAAYVDRWGRLCGRANVIHKCDLTPDHPPTWDSYAYVWHHNSLGNYYGLAVRRYVELRQQGFSYASLATCRQ